MKLTDKTKKELIDELQTAQERIAVLEQYSNQPGQALDHFVPGANQSFPHLAHMQEGIVIIFDRKLEFINDIFAELFGLSPQEACSSGFDPMSLIAPESRRYIRKQYSDGCRGGYTTKEIQYTGLSSDGRKIECETFLLFIPYKWGVAIQCTLQRVSVNKRIDEVLQRHYSDLPGSVAINNQRHERMDAWK